MIERTIIMSKNTDNDNTFEFIEMADSMDDDEYDPDDFAFDDEDEDTVDNEDHIEYMLDHAWERENP